MTHAKTALLPDRGVVRVTGEDAEKLLQGIITSDTELLAKQPAIHAALLTPQGKILFEFFVTRNGDGFLLETARDQTAGLVKRLSMYKLRAKVTFEVLPSLVKVVAAWGDAERHDLEGLLEVVDDREDMPLLAFSPHGFPDPRYKPLGKRWIVGFDSKGEMPKELRSFVSQSESDYHTHRISLGVPEGGKDYVLGDTFPHDANFDDLNGVSFTKGCFVGQEVVSRMQHRGTARKRVVIVEGDQPLQTGSEIMAGQATIGTIGSVAGNRGLALVRLDRVEEMQRKGERITAAGAALAIHLPPYMTPAVPAATP